MPEPAAARQPPPRPRRAARAAWRIGWVLLALASMVLTYGVLVVVGR
jgi:hypothetical protein